MNLLSQFKLIDSFAFDMDGVLTNGLVLVGSGEEWIRTSHIRDGYAIQLAISKGYRIVVITGSTSAAMRARFLKLGVTDFFETVSDKAAFLSSYMRDHHLQQEQMLFMGDDIPDLGAMGVAGIACCPADAAVEIRKQASFISALKGGEGCVREVIEKVLRLRGDWSVQSGIRSI